MKFAITILLTALFAFACGLYLPWWSIAPAAFLIALCIPQRPLFNFLSGFIGIFLTWAIVAWLRNDANEGILAEKIANLLGLNGSAFLLILVVALAGALIGGFAALTGGFLRPLKAKR